MLSHAFDDLGYRRVEWKCNNDNFASKSSAQRFGFSFEGVFRNHLIIKGENRNTAWFSIIDSEWPDIKKGYKKWLNPVNFNENGVQLCSLSECIRSYRAV